jgi:hypothetical protein
VTSNARSHDHDTVIEQVRTLPEPEALRRYTGLPPQLQWLVRRRMTGDRRSALILHHALTIAHCR